MRKAKQSTAKNVMVLMVDSTDHVTGKTGLTLTLTASKNGAAFASISPAVTERGNGWYSLALTASHTDTLGDLALHITGAAADPADMVLLVEAGATDADTSSRMATFTYIAPDNATIATIQADTNDLQARLPATLVGGRMDASVGAMAADVVTAAAIAAGAITSSEAPALANLDVAVSTRLATAGYTAPPSAATNATAIRSELTTELGRIDVATSSRLATAGYTAPPSAATNATAVRSELMTELGRIDVATSSRLATAGYTAPDNAGIASIYAAVDTEISAILAVVDAEVAAIKAKTDNLPADTATALTSLSTLTTEIRKLLRNKRVLDPTTGIETIYDDNGTALYTRMVYQDAAGTVPYADAGADRVERYE